MLGFFSCVSTPEVVCFTTIRRYFDITLFLEAIEFCLFLLIFKDLNKNESLIWFVDVTAIITQKGECSHGTSLLG